MLPTAKKVTYRIHFKRIVNRRLIMGTADGEVLVDGRLIYTANDLKVGLSQIRLHSDFNQTEYIKAKPPQCGGFFKDRIRPLLPCPPWLLASLPAIVTFDSASDRDTFLLSVRRCRPDNHVDVPVRAISFLSLHASFPSYWFLVEKKTVITKYAITVKQYRES